MRSSSDPVLEFSVVIPAFNASRHVAGAVGSALRQSEVRLEVIVVDDGSTDETRAVLSNFGNAIRVVHQENQGVAAARNRGAAESRSSIVAFLDADDLWEPHKLAKQRKALKDAPGASAAACAFMVVDEAGRRLDVRGGKQIDPLLEALLFQGNVIGTPSSVLVERSLFLATGGFSARLSQCADWEMWIRLALRTTFAVIPEPLVQYRQHSANMSRDLRLLERDSRLALELAFANPSLPQGLRDRRREAFARNERVLAGSYLQAGLYRAALACAAKAIVLAPREAAYILRFPLRRLQRWHA